MRGTSCKKFPAPLKNFQNIYIVMFRKWICDIPAVFRTARNLLPVGGIVPVQGLQVGNLGIADVQVFQPLAAGQRINGFLLVAVGQLQKIQLLVLLFFQQRNFHHYNL